MRTAFHVGTSGWDYEHWRGRLYPGGLPRSRWLEHYAARFPTVEVNSTFYRWPRERTLGRWRDLAPPGFTFTLKAPRTITHVRRLDGAAGKVAEFYDLAQVLDEAAGCILFQLPPRLRREAHFDVLERFLAGLDPARRNVIEFRHASWWHDEVFDLLRGHGTAFCVVSGLGMPGDAVATADFAYARFHGGHYDTPYTREELESWAGRLRRLPCDEVFAYFNNDAGGHAVDNALELGALLAG